MRSSRREAPMSSPSIMSSQSNASAAQPAQNARGDGAYDSIARPNLFAGASVFQRLFSFAAMLGTCLVAWFFHVFRTFSVDPDVWWHIKYGQSILATHHWPTI